MNFQQANVYGSAQRRKMRNFYGFYRKAVVLVPADEEFKQRINKCQEESSGLEIKESSILEYKGYINNMYTKIFICIYYESNLIVIDKRNLNMLFQQILQHLQ